MDEPTDTPPSARRRRSPAIAAATRLSPVQEAWERYVQHSLRQCGTCRRVDGSPCLAAEDLYRVYRALADAAFERLTGEAPSPRRQ